MFDRRAKKAEFRAAVRSRDVYDLAALFKSMAPVAAIQQQQEPSQQQDSLQENGTDWSGVLTAWLNACEAAEAVRMAAI
jgi:hypothetical protein